MSVEVVDVEPFEPPGISGFSIDAPTPGTVENGHHLTVSGWVLTPSGPPPLVQIALAGSDPLLDGPLAKSRLLVRRPGIGRHFADIPRADESGFSFSFGLVGFPRELELVVRAVLADGGAVPLARVRARRDPIDTGLPDGLQPVLLMVPGRAGSTWLTRLLGQHPQVVSYRPFAFEPRIASYWMEVLRNLSAPGSYSRAIHPERVDGPDWWIAERDRLLQADVRPNPQLNHWLTKDSPEDLAAFCQGKIEGFYQAVARDEGKEDVRFFAERAINPRLNAMIREFYPGFPRFSWPVILETSCRRGFRSWRRPEFSSSRAMPPEATRTTCETSSCRK